MPLKKRPNIGFIPTGTTNDFAMNFKISKFGISAAQSVVIGKPFPYDIGEFNGNEYGIKISYLTGKNNLSPDDIKFDFRIGDKASNKVFESYPKRINSFNITGYIKFNL